ncbi:MAG: fumarylacetoacetate hydrolase family protein [Chloroflexi bacterium]|nr:MAG: fumarylacetoacetate hydrolase family protein [Chloroflexota bacterium]TME19487.1 MAG: fumarylacetoacetate hydrolase family protein [Chloroflexota bacterium]TME19947.1 MAG: fumarylacetoacetate hydrolase family protein [Chloroflexota bacterium]
MRLVTVRTAGGTRAGRVEGDRIIELDFPDVGAILAAGALEQVRGATGQSFPLADADLTTPVPNPPKIICMGQNYEAHLREQNAELPKHPTLFNKFARSLIGPRDPIVLPRNSEKVDWEVELAFYIGRLLRHASTSQAQAAIAGYTVLNDVSMRDWQLERSSQWMQGKAFERSTPVGPWLITADEVDASNLRLTCEVDGQLMQDSTTADMVFTPAEIAAYASGFISLEPGDLFATGTPSGVGQWRKPQIFLKPGQTVRTAVEGVGECVNLCAPEDG